VQPPPWSALQEACLLGAYRPAHRLSDAQRHVRGRLAVRDALVRTRTGYIALTGALLRRHGWRVLTGSSEHTAPYDALVLGVDGEAEISIAGVAHRAAMGQLLALPAGQPHAVKAATPFKMLLVMIRA
jgi:Cupin domain